MSGPGAVNPQRREIEIIRVLFDRHLSDRAVALAESRWPGSGDVVRLAYEWAELSPGERRDRISTIGPEEIARLRALTELHPDLQATVDELDRRGVLPNLEQAALAGATSMASTEAQDAAQPDTSPIAETAPADQPAVTPPPQEPGADEPPETVAAEARASVPQPPADLPNDLQVDMPALDLGLPDTESFPDEQAQRRAQTAQDTEAAMERVHERLDRAANRTWSRTFPVASLPGIAPLTPLTDLPALTTVPDRPIATPQPAPADANLIEAPQRIIDAFNAARVMSLATPGEAPTDDELVAIANELGLGLKEFTLEPGRTRELFGGLQRVNSQITTKAGQLPSALAARNFVVIRGRMHANLVDRLNAGFADIPGTRATVKVHPDARVLLIPLR